MQGKIAGATHTSSGSYTIYMDTLISGWRNVCLNFYNNTPSVLKCRYGRAMGWWPPPGKSWVPLTQQLQLLGPSGVCTVMYVLCTVCTMCTVYTVLQSCIKTDLCRSSYICSSSCSSKLQVCYGPAHR